MSAATYVCVFHMTEYFQFILTRTKFRMIHGMGKIEEKRQPAE